MAVLVSRSPIRPLEESSEVEGRLTDGRRRSSREKVLVLVLVLLLLLLLLLVLVLAVVPVPADGEST